MYRMTQYTIQREPTMTKHARRTKRPSDAYAFPRELRPTPKHRRSERPAEPTYRPDELPVDEPLWGSRAQFVAHQLRTWRPAQ